MSEHPFAPFIRILGKGPRLSRDLTQEECRIAAGMILDGAVEPVQLGAFLCLLRVRTETAEEVAGFTQAIRERLARPAGIPTPDLDWPSYAGKSRQLPWFLLSALLLAENGIRIALHGGEGHTAGRLYATPALASLGIAPAASLAEAGALLIDRNLAYVPLALIHPRLDALMGLKALLGVRSPLHTVLRNLNPFMAKASLMSVFHPNYRAIHRDAALKLGEKWMACFKGEGGEVERRPEKPCPVDGLAGGVPFAEEWPAWDLPPPPPDQAMAPDRLAALWRGEIEDGYAMAVVVATAAIALKLLGRAEGFEQARALAETLWRDRPRDRVPP